MTKEEAKRNVLKLSGGQQQRVAIARALASEAPVILADEPTGNLDEDTAQDITEILKESAHKMNKCVVVVTHSGELAKQADVVFRLKKGELQVLERVDDSSAQPRSRRNNTFRGEWRGALMGRDSKLSAVKNEMQDQTIQYMLDPPADLQDSVSTEEDETEEDDVDLEVWGFKEQGK